MSMASRTVRIRLQGTREAVSKAKDRLPHEIKWSREIQDFAKSWSKASKEAPCGEKDRIPTDRVRVYGVMVV